MTAVQCGSSSRSSSRSEVVRMTMMLIVGDTRLNMCLVLLKLLHTQAHVAAADDR
jgi:hypothetical protein